MTVEQSSALSEDQSTQRDSGSLFGRVPVGYWFVAPAVLVLAITSLYPTVYSIVLSAFNWNWGTTMDFVGLQNYVKLLSDAQFWRIIFNTFYFAVGAVAAELLLGMGLALVVNQLGFGSGIIRTLLLTPLMISGIIVALMSKILLDPTLGIVNYLLSLVGLPKSAFFGSPTTAMPTVIMVDTWWQTAFVFIVLLAGLQSLPTEPFEAAEVDGASYWQRFRHLTLPLLRPVIITVLIFRSIDTLKVFAIIFGTTNGGPGIATEAVQTLTYRTAFKILQISEAMTIMVIFSIVILTISLLYVRYSELADAS